MFESPRRSVSPSAPGHATSFRSLKPLRFTLAWLAAGLAACAQVSPPTRREADAGSAVGASAHAAGDAAATAARSAGATAALPVAAPTRAPFFSPSLQCEDGAAPVGEAEDDSDVPRGVRAAAGGSAACPADMVLVEGSYCPNAQHECVEWLEDPAKFSYARCARFREPAKCASAERTRLRFCIDRDEYVAEGDALPLGETSWTDARATCERAGKRLCAEHEWTFACEGEDMWPYPYGFERDANLCNFEHLDLITPDGKLRDHRVPPASKPGCLSPFGVRNMVGNVDEWVVLDRPHISVKNGNRRMMSGLKGGWWGPLRNRCRPVTVDHDEHFHELQTGFRCCSSAPTAVAEGPAAASRRSSD
ncbi:MAG: SUMF1/EgtB/PvdO family nonheme iron enzyme [Polyangiaceae bacterium]|nr:SUMF1/EgtB/PvdO family nonheme iron enzyme [Polyangiaceae bacterium]